jgi:hypothetical protein
MVSLIDRIQEEMLSDDEDREKQSFYLKEAYENASEEAKKAIDWCFIALCGWSLKTLLEWQVRSSEIE